MARRVLAFTPRNL